MTNIHGRQGPEHLPRKVAMRLIQEPWPWILGALYLLYVALQTPLGKPKFDVHDDGGKYAYVPSLFFDQDLDFLNQARGYNQAFSLTPTGLSRADWSIGPALLWLPFFAVGHGLALLLRLSGFHPTLDGYGTTYCLATEMGTLCYGWLGLLLLYDLLRRLYGPRAAGWASLVAFFSSLLPYYTLVRARHDHGLSAFAMSAMLWSFYRLREEPGLLLRWAILGMATGLAAVMRVNDVFIVAPVLLALLPVLHKSVRSDVPVAMGRLAGGLVLWGGLALLFYTPQLLANRIVWGTWIGTSDNTDLGINILAQSSWIDSFLDPRRWGAILIGARYGIPLQMPFVLPALIGLILRLRTDPLSTLAWGGYLGMVMAGMLIWSGMIPAGDYWGENYGYRYTCATVPFLALGLGEVLHRILSKNRPRFWICGGLCILLVIWQAVQFVQIDAYLPYDTPFWVIRAATGLPQLLCNEGLGLLVRLGSWTAMLLAPPFPNFASAVLFIVAAPLGLILWMLLCGVLRRRGSRRWLLGSLLLSMGVILPVLWIEIRHPRKSEQEIYQGLLLRVEGAMVHPYGSDEVRLIERGRRMAERLDKDTALLDAFEGYAYFRIGETAGAEQRWERALQQDRDLPLAHLGLALLETFRRHPGKAEVHLQHARQDPLYPQHMKLCKHLAKDRRIWGKHSMKKDLESRDGPPTQGMSGLNGAEGDPPME